MGRTYGKQNVVKKTFYKAWDFLPKKCVKVLILNKGNTSISIEQKTNPGTNILELDKVKQKCSFQYLILGIYNNKKITITVIK